MPSSDACAHRARREIPFTPERIIELAGRPEGFRVSWRWRDEWLVHRCAKLVKAGKLRRINRKEKGAYYYGLPRPVEPAPAPAVAEPVAFDADLFG